MILVVMASMGAYAVANNAREQIKMVDAKVKDNVQIKTTLPTVSNDVFILRTVESTNFGHSSELAEKILGTKNLKDFGSDNTKSVLRDRDDSEIEVTIYKGGQLEYSTGKEWSNTYKKEEFLSEKQAKDAAKGIVQKLIDADTLNKDMVDISKSEIVNDEMCAYDTKNGKIDCKATNQHVNIPISYKGIKIDGPGGKVRTYFSKGGEMVGLINSVGKLVVDEKVSIITPKDAIEKLKQDGYRDIDITTMELVYEAKSPEESTGTIEPSYKIEGVQHTPSGDDIRFGMFIPAKK